MRPIRYGDQRQFVCAASDVATQITSPTKRYLLIVNPVAGIATNYRMILPDARTIRVGTPFVFENQSSNFVGVYNSDLTTWHRVPPRATLTCTLETQGSSAGTWSSMVHDPGVANPSYGLAGFCDFTTPFSAGIVYGSSGIGWSEAHAGTGAAVGASASSAGGRQGMYQLTSGTTNASYALLYAGASGQSNYLGSGCRSFEILQCVSALSTAADEVVVRAGIGDNVAGAAHTNGVFFLYDRATYGDFWAIKNINGSGNNTVATLTAPTAGNGMSTLQKLRLEVNSDASRSDFWIDKALVSPAGGLATYVPLTSTAVKLGVWGISRSAYSAAARNALVDYIRVQSYPTTPR